MDDVERQGRVPLLLADGRADSNRAVANLQDGLSRLALGVADFDAMHAVDADVAHLIGDRVRAVPG
jgi:hypothetical protein